MFIEIKEVGKRKKYYLVNSFRQNSKVKKIRKFLGSDLKKEQLEKKKIIAEKQLLQRINIIKKINDPLLEEFSKRQITEINDLIKNKFNIFHLSENQWQEFSEVFTYNTNAIEGSMLEQKEVENLLGENIWPQNQSKNDIAEAYGVKEAIDYVRKTKGVVSIELINKLHKIVFKNSKSFAGKLRKKGERVVVINSYGETVHEGAPPEKIKEMLTELVGWYEKHKKKYPPMVLAAVVHNQFENIHPFRDGNGRVGRLLLNNVLLKHNLPPVNIDFEKRKDYYKTLQEYENNHNLRPTIELILEEYKILRKTLKIGGTHKK